MSWPPTELGIFFHSPTANHSLASRAVLQDAVIGAHRVSGDRLAGMGNPRVERAEVVGALDHVVDGRVAQDGACLEDVTGLFFSELGALDAVGVVRISIWVRW